MTSVLSSEDPVVTSMDVSEIPCPVPGEQLNRDCQVLALLRPDSPAEQKLEIILNFGKFNPPSTYKFPTKLEYGKNRAFQYRYLQTYHWLGYSVALDGCFCLPCCLFSSAADHLENFVQKPFSNWTKLNEKVKAHSASSIHMRCTQDLKSFKEAHWSTAYH